LFDWGSCVKIFFSVFLEKNTRGGKNLPSQVCFCFSENQVNRNPANNKYVAFMEKRSIKCENQGENKSSRTSLEMRPKAGLPKLQATFEQSHIYIMIYERRLHQMKLLSLEYGRERGSGF
jgi:hypothetical protein